MSTTNDDRSRAPHRDFAGRVALATVVVVGILALVAVVWAGRLIVALLFFAIVIASAIRPSVEAMKRRTRNYARRQLTWMRRLERVRILDAGRAAPAELAERLVFSRP